ncbi:MAG: gliding motility-associated C-terminal domain-containing protein [Bacteroidales bacterium]|nr:gliding motility-associated C-terminal domain-containing protein [Bacteroidales bacterium]
MKIEDLFKEKMSNANIKAPENLWNKIENNLNNPPQSPNIDTNAQNIISNASSALNTTLVKTLAISFGVAASAVGGYLIYDNLQQEPISQQTIAQTTPQTQKEIETTFDTTTLIAQKTSPITKQATPETIEYQEITVNDTTTTQIEISETKIEQTITEQPQIKQEPTPTQTPIVENKPAEEPIVTKEENTITPQKEFNPNIKRPNFISPNNDGINDVFRIENLEAYPENEIVIFDQKGRIIFQSAPYNNDWEAANVQQGTYFYKLLIKEGKNKKILNGSITIIL